MADTIKRLNEYIKNWKAKGYPDDIPDEVPDVLANKNLAPSYKAIAVALLKNDLHLEALGFSAPKSAWYSAIKRVEIAARDKKHSCVK